MPAPFSSGQSPSGRSDGADGWFLLPAGRAVLDSEHAAILQSLGERPAQPWVWIGPQPSTESAPGRGLALAAADDGWTGPVRCRLPLPMASESVGTVVLQHVHATGARHAALLEECARILSPGGRLLLFALNPIAPYRLRWRGSGLFAHEPVTWRRRLRAAGLQPEPVSQGIGPSWAVRVSRELQHGPGLRAAYRLVAEKRAIPLTPVRLRKPLELADGLPAA